MPVDGPPRRPPSRAALLWISLLPLPLVAAQCGFPSAGPIVMAGALAERGRTHERFETAGNLWGEFSNPFDPAQVRLDGEFVAPDGSTLVLPGFYTQRFSRALVGSAEQLTRRGQPHWRVRMTPTQPGAWQWRWVMTTPQGSAATAWECFEVDPPAADRHGFLRRSPLDGRYLRFDDGTPYVTIGENLGWYDARGTFAYDDWFAKLAAPTAFFTDPTARELFRRRLPRQTAAARRRLRNRLELVVGQSRGPPGPLLPLRLRRGAGRQVIFCQVIRGIGAGA